MPKAPSEKVNEAKKLFDGGMPMVDIAKKLGVSDGTVRCWKNRYGWGGKSKKNQRNVANKTDDKTSATLQKKKRGGQPGNKNSKGVSHGKGNPHPSPPPVNIKHGGYAPVFLDALDADEQGLIGTVPEDEEELLLEQIQLFSIRERRIMRAINKYRGMKGEVALSDVTKFEDKRTFKDEEEAAEYDRIQKIKVDNKKILPGKPYSMQTHTTNKDMVIARLEQELSTVQGKKTKAIEALAKIRLEKAKINSANAGNEAVDDWIEAILGEEAGIDG